MIEPTIITKFNRTQSQLEEFWLFCILVAGKNSDFAARKLAGFLKNRGDLSPFDYIRGNINSLHNMLVAHKVGQYVRIENAIKQSLNLNLQTCSLDDLLRIYGVGPKTASFFLMHSRRNYIGAVLDVHILKWLRDHGVSDAPKNTPSNIFSYRKFSTLWLDMSKAIYGNLSPSERDLLIWSEYSGRS